jgi:hypothetical protein
MPCITLFFFVNTRQTKQNEASTSPVSLTEENTILGKISSWTSFNRGFCYKPLKKCGFVITHSSTMANMLLDTIALTIMFLNQTGIQT